jgi:hypothetical protein
MQDFQSAALMWALRAAWTGDLTMSDTTANMTANLQPF